MSSLTILATYRKDDQDLVAAAGDEIRDAKIRRSVCFAYAVLLMAFCLRHAERVDWLERFGQRLLAFADLGNYHRRLTNIAECLLCVFCLTAVAGSPIVEAGAQFSREPQAKSRVAHCCANAQ